MSSSVHTSSIVIDGLVISRWSRSVFEDMQRGGLTAANCTCSVWEGFRPTMLNIAEWKKWFREHADLITPVKNTADIRRAKETGKVGIILGFQNTSGLEDRVDSLALFKDLGVGVIQLTYNTQNLIGAGCFEENDTGLSGFGREVVAEMNRVGIAIDLSHVGPKTASDAIEFSKVGCVYTHVCPSGLLNHPRNKTDEQLRKIIDRGGFVGVATYAPFMPKGKDSNLDDCVDLFNYMINVCGEENIGIGTDFTQDQDQAFFEWLFHDKGYARRMIPTRTTTPFVSELTTLASYPNLTRAMERRGWSETRIVKVLGENWLGYLDKVWSV